MFGVERGLGGGDSGFLIPPSIHVQTRSPKAY